MFELDRIAASGLVAAIDYHESIGSTSDRALELAAQGEAALPLLVVAEHQTAGRGRGANRWLSAPGALTFSLALEAPPQRLAPGRRPQAALAAGLAVCEALEGLVGGADLRLKWPNDVYLEGRKVCGILCESVPGWNDRLVVGIGMNVNNTTDFGLRSTAVALIEYDGLPRDLTGTLVAVLDQFDLRWRMLLEGGFAAVADSYRKRCLLTGKTLTIQAGDQTLVGRCCGIDEEGALQVQTVQGQTRIFSGTVSRWEAQ